MDDDSKSASATPAFPATLNFDYLKGSQFRVLHVDGAFTGLTQTGVSVSFFSERQPIPRRVVHKVNKDGSLGEEIKEQRVVRDAVIRDVDITVVMNIEVAKAVVSVLSNMISAQDELIKKALETEKKGTSEHP
jgi:hypothetical protein